jgi:hypothetical protein
VSGALVRARIVSSTPPVVAGDGTASGEPVVTYTDTSGAWTLALPQGLSVWIEIPAAGVDHTFTVPSSSTATFGALTLTEASV